MEMRKLVGAIAFTLLWVTAYVLILQKVLVNFFVSVMADVDIPTEIQYLLQFLVLILPLAGTWIKASR